MDLHANAALSLNKRRLLARRVVEEQWTVTQAAAAAEVSVRCARKWVGRYRAEGELGLLDRSSAPASVANRTPEDRIQAIAALRRLRFTGPEIAEVLGMAAVDRVGDPYPDRDGQARPPWARACRGATSAPAPASSSTSTSRSSAASRAAPASACEAAPAAHTTARITDRHGRRRNTVGLGVRAYRDRRLHSARLRRGARRREGHHRDRLPAPRGRLSLSATRSRSNDC